MDRLPKVAILTRLARELRERGSWCGETHLQKAVYLLQEMLGVPLGFSYILYHHGPYSFDLADEITALRADGLMELEPQAPQYGPKLRPSERAATLEGLFPRTMGTYERHIRFVADKLGHMGVVSLERLATAFYVMQELPDADLPQRRDRLIRLKPHIKQEFAEQAFQEVEVMQREAMSLPQTPAAQ
ncbi:hypothetical protein HS125_04120 [bacterium]|nr:hypothetical protein [bacterium]